MSTHETLETQHAEPVSPQNTGENQGGLSLPPPPLDLGGDAGGNPIQRKDEAPSQSFTPTPVAQLQEGPERLTDAAHPDHSNPLLNSNTAYMNLQLVYEEWLGQGGSDNRALAIMLAQIMTESASTFQSLNEGLSQSQFAEGGTNQNYAQEGYWGRGLAQTTHAPNYFLIDQAFPDMGLADNPDLYLLPTISAPLSVNTINSGMYSAAILNDSMDTYVANNDIRGSRNLVAPTAGPEERERFEARVDRILAAINSWDPASGQSLPEHLYFNTAEFRNCWNADAERILEANTDFSFPQVGGFPNADYQNSVNETGYSVGLQIFDPDDSAALARFQFWYNQNFTPDPLLNEDGVADQATMQALLAGGFQMSSGNNMIESVTNGEASGRDLIGETFQALASGDAQMSIEQAAADLYSYMPTPNEGVFLSWLSGASVEVASSDGTVQSLALPAATIQPLVTALVLAAEGQPNGLGVFNPGIRENFRQRPFLQNAVEGTPEQRAYALLTDHASLPGSPTGEWRYYVISSNEETPGTVAGIYPGLDGYGVNQNDVFYPNGTAAIDVWGLAAPNERYFWVGDVVIIRLSATADLPFGAPVALQRTEAPLDEIYFP